ncbi:hypothetical protein QQ054_32045 [Oscillatoria amoena NRMC-F 0135]|nr:hypothetical protein [Oscillatoria amoena NRMC-F 0135]
MVVENLDKAYLQRREIHRSVQAWLLSSEPAVIPAFDWVEILHSLDAAVVISMYDYLVKQRRYGFTHVPLEEIFDAIVMLR